MTLDDTTRCLEGKFHRVLDLVERFVAKVDALMALCDQLEKSLAAADTARRSLLEALLHEALAPATEALEAA